MPAAATQKNPKATATKKAEASHPTYRDMIADAISTLKERNGSSRQALKKYIQSNFKDLKNFDTQFNAALRRGVEKGDFTQPKGPSGPVKLNKKKDAEKKPKPEKKEGDKEAKPKKAAAAKPKKAAADKEAKPKKTATKKEVAPKKAPKERVEKAAAKPKANAAKKVKKAAAVST
ncbi:linker histone H1 and H5 family-domain-containing protein [Terfezia claveryi]|nr:linker histone H1 and H5 family-domain-containing protein [Terfezia claveryi]